MRQRCNDVNHVRYAQYGGRGIAVCERWASFANFLEDMGMPPQPGLSLERTDSDKGYEPGNCVWATNAQQARNKTSNRFYTLGDKTLCLSDWASDLGISFGSLKERIAKWPLERALTTPKLPNQGPRK